MSNGITLTPIGSTFVYTATGQTLAFLLWDNTAPAPAQIPLANTWAASGPPAAIGYYLFLSPTAQSVDTTTLEAHLRAILPVPATTGCVWAKIASVAPSNVTIVQITPGAVSQPPAIAVTTSIVLPPGVPTLGFSANTPVRAIFDANGNPSALVFTAPGFAQPGAAGVKLALTDSLARCLAWTALVSFPGQGTAAAAVKQVVAMQLDPLEPFGSHTHGNFEHWSVFLTVGPGGRLSR